LELSDDLEKASQKK